jgi:uncharacterized small protein (DUF1192 family)
MRHGLRSGGDGISFFFFQDIITCLIGIVLFIALLLTLFAGEKVSENSAAAAGAPASAAQKKTLNELISRVVQMRKDVKTAMLSVSSDAEIAQKSAAARSELEDLKNQMSRYAGSKAPTGGNAEVKQSVDALRQRSALLQGEVDVLASEEAEKNKQIGELSEALAALEAKLLQEAKDVDHIWLDPTASNTTKHPLLLIVNREGFELKELGGAKGKTKEGKDLSGVLASYPTTDYFTVIYFRPSTWDRHAEVTKAVRAMGFEIGTDALREEQKLDFQDARQ